MQDAGVQRSVNTYLHLFSTGRAVLFPDSSIPDSVIACA